MDNDNSTGTQEKPRSWGATEENGLCLRPTEELGAIPRENGMQQFGDQTWKLAQSLPFLHLSLHVCKIGMVIIIV